MLYLDHIRRCLDRHRPDVTPFAERPRRAAVAMVLAGEDEDLRLCLIRRAEREGDPWSGHIALPGGRAEPADGSAQAAAERETHEEVGLCLDAEHRLGALSEMPVRIRGVVQDMVLSSFVFYLGTRQEALQPNHEVAEAFWMPLDHLWDAGNGTELEFEHLGVRRTFPGIAFGEHVIWGLTFRVLGLFSQVLEYPLPSVSPPFDPPRGTVTAASATTK